MTPDFPVVLSLSPALAKNGHKKRRINILVMFFDLQLFRLLKPGLSCSFGAKQNGLAEHVFLLMKFVSFFGWRYPRDSPQ